MNQIIQLCAIALLITALFILITSLFFLTRKNSIHYKLLYMIIAFWCGYLFFYCCQILTMGTGDIITENEQFFYLMKKAMATFASTYMLMFALNTLNNENIYKKLKWPLLIICLAMTCISFTFPFNYEQERVGYDIYFNSKDIFLNLLIFYIGASCALSVIILILACKSKSQKIGLKEFLSLVILFLPADIYILFFPTTRPIFDVFGLNSIIIVIYMFYITTKSNGYIVFPILKDTSFELISDGILVVNQNKRIKDFNTALTKIFKDIDFSNVVDASLPKVFNKHTAIMYTLDSLKAQILTVNEKFYTVEAFISEKTESTTIYTLTFKDTTEYILSLKKLRAYSVIDYLTQLKNKQFFIEILNVEITKALRYSVPFIVMYVDIDNFSQINNKYGHIAGDSVIIKIGNLINKEIRKSDLVSRFDEDSFTILLTNTESRYADIVAERIRKRIENAKLEFEDKTISATVSIGIVNSIDDASKSINYYIDNAIIRCNDAKSNGKNQICFEKGEN